MAQENGKMYMFEQMPIPRAVASLARKERELQKPPKNARELYRFLHAMLEKPLDLFREEEEDDENA